VITRRGIGTGWPTSDSLRVYPWIVVRSSSSRLQHSELRSRRAPFKHSTERPELS
jgi:hypothetical protein